MNNKNRRSKNIPEVFKIFAFIYLIYAIINTINRNFVINVNSELHIFDLRWISFLNDVANGGFKVLVLFGISAILRKLIKD
ncbi:hypothetical protein KM914_17495 [Virgibacillus pantothenticus]|uniref:hypothetical protein n=1 Tax=Virgibacillus pantothenticus TaxID=1473 RepID=UPI001C211DF8|nr:hypothetical protein [Virgibacillus pantothenticus]MBU8568186.1 hypothetical protein [Virgibacillus pantothenticus]MBU8601888.1 hypothetical protein [Virgibacillus pantothenticus]MBU8636019.1 hypothetical protein [Virgibacillus pantothenticus]MBU8644098.1 hypothetical protein [Virgibacillus pantothenticus]MBU8647950.1 hypothetical protein [Virgibacillus pantothenticus]